MPYIGGWAIGLAFFCRTVVGAVVVEVCLLSVLFARVCCAVAACGLEAIYCCEQQGLASELLTPSSVDWRRSWRSLFFSRRDAG